MGKVYFVYHSTYSTTWVQDRICNSDEVWKGNSSHAVGSTFASANKITWLALITHNNLVILHGWGDCLE